MKALIDGDVLTYRVGFACESRHYVDEASGEQYSTKKEAPKEAKLTMVQEASDEALVELALDKSVGSILRMLRTDDYKIFLSDADSSKNFRAQVATTVPYKGTRTGIKPVHYKLVRQLMCEEYGAEIVSGIEADDALGIAQTDTTVVVSIDKDLLMIPGYHLHIGTGARIKASDPGGLKLYRNGAGDLRITGHGFKWFCAQMFLGDSIDNIVGVNRCGPKKTFDLLKKATTIKDMWKIVEKVYKEQMETGRLEENANLLWIQRADAKTYEEMLNG